MKTMFTLIVMFFSDLLLSQKACGISKKVQPVAQVLRLPNPAKNRNIIHKGKGYGQPGSQDSVLIK